MKEQKNNNAFANFLVFLIIAGFIAAVILPKETKLVKVNKYDIINLKNVKGNYYIGSSDGDVVEYTFYYSVNDGTKTKTIKACNANIVYSNKLKAVKYKETPTNDDMNHYSVKIDDYDYSYKIFIPEESIKLGYEKNNK